MTPLLPGYPKRTVVSDSISPRLMAGICLSVSVSVLVIWYVDSQQGMMTLWTTLFAQLLAFVCAVVGVLVLIRPAWLNALMAGCLLLTGVYFLGCMHYATLEPGEKGLYELAGNAQLVPLLYVCAFISMRKGATTLSWVHYAGVVLSYVLHYWYTPPGNLLPSTDLKQHKWFILLLTIPCYILALQYITTLKSRLRQSELDIQASKERFLAMLSHEIRSPLQAMLGSIDLLGLKVQSAPERRAVDRLRQSAAQLDAHLRDVTEYTRLENPSWQLQIDTVDMAALVRDVCDTYQQQASAKGLRIYCEIPPEQERSLKAVQTDARRVRQILSNLITNAIKYTPQGNVAVQLCGAPSPGSFLLEVSDTGIGIPAHEQTRIFEPYVRLEDRRTTGEEGSGLGLAVVQRLVDRLGGTLELNSQLDIGSTFKVTLPMQARQ